jgi:hypothetical protein
MSVVQLDPRRSARGATRSEFLQSLGIDNQQVPLIMDRTYEGNERRVLAESPGFEPVVPPVQTSLEPWEYNTEFCMRRSRVERLLGRIKRIRRAFTHYNETDQVFGPLVTVPLVADLSR